VNRWDVHKFRVPDINVSYPKFVIVAQLYSTSFLGVLINTDMTILQKETPAMHKCHPVILQSEHPFLDYDSRIGCASAFELDMQFLTQTNFQGRLSSKAIQDLLLAVGFCNIMPRPYKRDILDL
jgi:hypothetical protein